MKPKLSNCYSVLRRIFIAVAMAIAISATTATAQSGGRAECRSVIELPSGDKYAGIVFVQKGRKKVGRYWSMNVRPTLVDAQSWDDERLLSYSGTFLYGAPGTIRLRSRRGHSKGDFNQFKLTTAKLDFKNGTNQAKIAKVFNGRPVSIFILADGKRIAQIQQVKFDSFGMVEDVTDFPTNIFKKIVSGRKELRIELVSGPQTVAVMTADWRGYQKSMRQLNAELDAIEGRHKAGQIDCSVK